MGRVPGAGSWQPFQPAPLSRGSGQRLVQGGGQGAESPGMEGEAGPDPAGRAVQRSQLSFQGEEAMGSVVRRVVVQGSALASQRRWIGGCGGFNSILPELMSPRNLVWK